MNAFSDLFSRLMQRIADVLGFHSSEASQLEQTREKLENARRDNYDRLEALKREIAVFETRLKEKDKELNATSGERRRILVLEIEQGFRDLDRLKGRLDIISGNLERISTVIAKFDELAVARDNGVDEDTIDGLAIDLEDALEDLKGLDRAARDLNRVAYAEPQREKMDIEDRMAETQGTRQEERYEVPEAVRQRLEQLRREE